MRRLLPLAIPFLLTACSNPVETVTLSGQVKLPLASVNAFQVDGAPLLLSNFDGTLGKVHAASLDAGGRFSFKVERSSLPESAQWFKLVLMHPERKEPMLSRALVLSRGSGDAEGLELQSYTSLTQMAMEYQYQLDPARVPTSLSPTAVEAKLADSPDAYLLDNSFHGAYAQYASGSTKVAPAANSNLAALTRDLLFPDP